MKPLKTSISITLDYDVVDKLRAMAEYDDRSLSSCINLILREHLRNLENKKG